MSVYRDDHIPIQVPRQGTFTIVLESIPTAGYEWTPTYDSVLLELLEQKFIGEPKAIGGAREESFEFQALKAGETQLKMLYKRSWETEIRETKTFTVEITD